MAIIVRYEDLQNENKINDLDTKKVDLTAYNAGMNDVTSKLTALRTDMENADKDVKAYAEKLVTDLTNNQVKALEDAVKLLNEGAGVEGSIDYKINNAVKNLIDGAPDTLDTLKEIVDFIKNNDVNLENLIDSINTKIKNLVGNASADYNTLEKIEARIKEAVAAHAADMKNVDAKITNVQNSIPVYDFESGLAINTDDNGVRTITLPKVPFGSIINGVATLFYDDGKGDLVKLFDVTVSHDSNDKTGKVYKLELPDNIAKQFADQLKQAKAMVSFFWRPIDQ